MSCGLFFVSFDNILIVYSFPPSAFIFYFYFPFSLSFLLFLFPCFSPRLFTCFPTTDISWSFLPALGGGGGVLSYMETLGKSSDPEVPNCLQISSWVMDEWTGLASSLSSSTLATVRRWAAVRLSLSLWVRKSFFSGKIRILKGTVERNFFYLGGNQQFMSRVIFKIVFL